MVNRLALDRHLALTKDLGENQVNQDLVGLRQSGLSD